MDGWRRRSGAALLAAIAALVLFAPFVVALTGRAAASARADTISDARNRLDDASIFRSTGEIDPPGNVWVVNPIDRWSDPVGDVWTNPPLFSVAEPAAGQPVAQILEYDLGGPWLGYGQWQGGTEVLVTVIERDAETATVAASQRRWWATAAALAALVGLATFLLIGRMQAPVRRAHLVNRDFIADAAHELRTPLSIIQASAGFALSRERPPEDYRESLTEILDASERAGASVGELLEFARLEAGQASLRLAPLRLDLLVEEVAASIRIDGVTVEAEPGEGVVVEADYNLMRQVIDNIVRNAAARATKVTIATRLASGRATIEVADDGPGFDPGIIDHVFERFRRGDRSGAVGLGMAITRTIVELHGGRCTAANQPSETGGGALVTVSLPSKAS